MTSWIASTARLASPRYSHLPALRHTLAAYTPPVEAAVESAVEAAVGAATAVVTSPSRAAFWQLAFAFVFGGLFFSAVTTAVGAAYAIGTDNVRRGLRLFMLLSRRVWVIVVAALKAARSEVLGDSKTRWREVWALLGEGLGEAKRAAAEGVEAIKLEADLYAFALGAPGLLTLQYVVDRQTPHKLAAAVEESLRASLRDVKSSFGTLSLRRFAIGGASPRMLAARTPPQWARTLFCPSTPATAAAATSLEPSSVRRRQRAAPAAATATVHACC